MVSELQRSVQFVLWSYPEYTLCYGILSVLLFIIIFIDRNRQNDEFWDVYELHEVLKSIAALKRDNLLDAEYGVQSFAQMFLCDT
jgi:hypothetical protein